MNLPQNFSQALEQLGPDATLRIVEGFHARRAPYLLEMFLPDRLMPNYSVEDATLRIIPTMAAPTGMDQPYPEGGAISASSFLEKSAKFTQKVILSEETQRHWQYMMRLQPASTNLQSAAAQFIINAVVQAQMDTAEYLRGQVLSTGAINWQYNNTPVQVNYGVPATNQFAINTIASTNHYAGPNSNFWNDAHQAQELLNFNVMAVLMSRQMYTQIVSNVANEISILSSERSALGYMTVSLGRYQSVNGVNVPSADHRDNMTVYVYEREASIIDPANPQNRLDVPFLDPETVTYIAQPSGSLQLTGMGSTPNVEYDRALGYMHVAPTVEGGGRMGRWFESYVPERAPWSLIARSAANELPVIHAPSKLVMARSELV